MKALTVWQPWASLIAIGAKPYDFRGWEAPKWIWGKRIAIHAGARPVKADEVLDLVRRLDDAEEAWTTALNRELAVDFLDHARRFPKSLPLSSILCTVVIGQPVDSATIAAEFGGPATINDSDRNEHGRFAWPMREVEPLVPPVEAKGAQGFWEWSGA